MNKFHNYSQIISPIFIIILAMAMCYIPLDFLNFTPTSDAWVMAVVNAQKSEELNIFTMMEQLFTSKHSRVFRTIPYILLNSIKYEGFAVLTGISFFLHVMTTYGIYKIFGIYTSRALAVFLALLFILYPIDGTLFFLGASGVHISLCLIVWSLYFIITYSNGGRSILFFIIGLLFLFIANKSYPGHILVAFFCISTHLFYKMVTIRHEWIKYFVIYVLILAIYFFSLIPLVIELLNNEMRNASVADIDVGSALLGAAKALYTSFISAPASVFGWGQLKVVGHRYDFNMLATTQNNFLYLVIFLVAALSVFYLIQGDTLIKKRDTLYSLAFSGVLFFLGYFPYSITILRYNDQKELLFSRFGVCIFAGIVILVIHNRFRKIFSKKVCAVIAALTVTLVLNQKMTIAEKYSQVSKEQRFFLGEVAELFPVGVDVNSFVFFVESESAIARLPHMIKNRPEWMLRYLFEEIEIKAVTVTNHAFRTGGVKYYSDTNEFGRERWDSRVNIGEAVPLKYTPGVGVTPISEIILVGPAEELFRFDFNPVITSDADRPSPRIDWFASMAR